MEETNHIDQLDPPPTEEVAHPEPSQTSSQSHTEPPAEDQSTVEAESIVDPANVQPSEPQEDVISPTEPDTANEPETEEATTEEPALADLSHDSLDDWIQDGYLAESVPETDGQEASEINSTTQHEQAEELQPLPDNEDHTDSEHEGAPDSSELDYTTDTDSHYDGASSIVDSCDLERSHSLRTEALIQAAARAVLSMRDGPGNGEEHYEDVGGSTRSLTPTDDLGSDETAQLDDHEATTSRPDSPASHTLPSPTAQSSVGESAEGSHNGAEDDVFSDRSRRSSGHSSDEHDDNDTIEQTTEKGQESPYARSRIASGVSTSDASVVSDLSRLSRYEKEDFVPTSRENRPAFRSPSSVRALQMSSPTPSIITSPTRSAKRQGGFPTISRLGSPSISGHFSPRGRSTPSRFKKQEAPLVLLHVTLLPLRWSYGEMMNYFEAKKLAPLAFSSEGIKNLRGAWRQLQDRLGDTVLERGILLPHPQNDYEVLEERMLESLELPLRRRARILECGHYLGPSNEMSIDDDVENESEYNSDTDESDARVKEDKKHWCKTCRGDIKYEELGTERVFRIKVYASNGLMSAGAWDACWKEMERVDLEVEPIIDSGIQSDLAKLSAAFDNEKQKQLEAEQNQLAEEEQKFQLEAEQRLSLEEERQQLEAQRQEFEQERRRSLEESQRKFEEERRKIEAEQRQRLEEERRQQFEEERQLLDAQRQQFEEQRIELEEQRKLVEEEQRQHVEETRRQELELEQKLIEEQRQELEEARQQFEEERRQRLEEEEELRRLQREEDEQKQVATSRSASRNSYVEDDPSSTERATSTELEPRRRDSDRLREIYGNDSRASSDGLLSNSSPAIHIHVDSGRQREDEQNSRQLAIATPRASSPLSGSAQDLRHPDSYIAPPSPPSPSQQAYQRREAHRKSLDSASLPELLGETIRVLFQDPKNVAIAVLVVLIAMLAGQFATRQERGMEIYKPQQHYQHHQLDPREPVGQVIMNTPPSVETVYQTVTAQPVAQQAPASKDVEVIYQTVTEYPSQEMATRVVETIYSTVTAASQAAAPEIASELPPTSADPSVDLPFDSSDDEATSIATAASSASLIALGLDPFVCPASSVPEPESDEGIFKTANSDEELGRAAKDIHAPTLPDAATQEDDPNTSLAPSNNSENHKVEMASVTSSNMATATTTTTTSTNTRMAKESSTITETVTKTIIKTAIATDLDPNLKATSSGYDRDQV